MKNGLLSVAVGVIALLIVSVLLPDAAQARGGRRFVQAVQVCTGPNCQKAQVCTGPNCGMQTEVKIVLPTSDAPAGEKPADVPAIPLAPPTPSATADTPPALTTTPSQEVKAEEVVLTEVEATILAETNAARVRAGLRPFVLCPRLLGTAREHGIRMASSGHMTHFGSNYRVYGSSENVAYRNLDPVGVVRHWLSSSGHRANILGGYSRIGIAAYTTGNGTVFYVQQFGR